MFGQVAGAGSLAIAVESAHLLGRTLLSKKHHQGQDTEILFLIWGPDKGGGGGTYVCEVLHPTLELLGERE